MTLRDFVLMIGSALFAVAFSDWRESRKRKHTEERMKEQEGQLQVVIGQVKDAAAGAGTRVAALIEKIKEKTDHVEVVDLSDEIAELSGVADTLNQLGQVTTDEVVGEPITDEGGETVGVDVTPTEDAPSAPTTTDEDDEPSSF